MARGTIDESRLHNEVKGKEKTAQNIQWTAPPEGSRNHNGEIEALYMEHLKQVADAEHAECLALFKAVEFAKEEDITHCIFEGDAMNVINRVKKHGKDLSYIGHVIDEIKKGCLEFSKVQVYYVNRKGNAVAHVAANVALEISNRCLWYDNFPVNVLEVAVTEII
ncbi:OLC1v1012334C1 [Oldenlandia corymbosa var. corymbosa]|uniref:OLC1v1012334C1 n=1 Tax=Oldenlandia corymbosa var. corymbosa TaxID=529605 RepID=A0AAV1DZ25_OLDCO|nr:OLC1v1012334C1 [Oldenlandia corymbosa var. corymbosa]